jgi:hypothetical protein
LPALMEQLIEVCGVLKQNQIVKQVPNIHSRLNVQCAILASYFYCRSNSVRNF